MQNLSTKGEPFGNCFMQVHYCTCIFPALLQIALLVFRGLGFIHAHTVIFSFISSCIHAFHSSLLNAPSTRNSALKKSNFNIYKFFFTWKLCNMPIFELWCVRKLKLPRDPKAMALQYFVYCLLHPDTSMVHFGQIWQDAVEGK